MYVVEYLGGGYGSLAPCLRDGVLKESPVRKFVDGAGSKEVFKFRPRGATKDEFQVVSIKLADKYYDSEEMKLIQARASAVLKEHKKHEELAMKARERVKESGGVLDFQFVFRKMLKGEMLEGKTATEERAEEQNKASNKVAT